MLGRNVSRTQSGAKTAAPPIRGLSYAAGALLALFLAAVPIPYVPTQTMAQIVIDILAKPMPAYFAHIPPGDSFMVYWHVCLWLTLILSHPVLLRHVLDMTALGDLPDRQRRLRLALFGGLLAFIISVVTYVTYLLP